MEQYRYGKHAVLASINHKKVERIFILSRFSDSAILATIHANQLPIERVEEQRLVALVGPVNHQGIVAKVSPFAYTDLSLLLTKMKSLSQPLLLMVDQIEDPQNLGAIIRTAVGFSVQGILLKKDRQVGVNATVAKVASGALDYIDVVEVVNLSQTLTTLKKQGFWIVGSALQESEDFRQVDYRGPIVLVVGSEAKGISRLVLEHCDFRVKIPIAPVLESLNAATAAAIILAEVQRQRLPLK